MSFGPIARLGAGAATLATLAAMTAPAAAESADRIYWANFGAPERISFANLDGTGGMNLNTAGAIMKIPIGLALDPAGGRAYWTNTSAPGAISYASLDGGPGAGTLKTGAADVKGPAGAAIDQADRRIYWGNIGDSTISWANLDGSGGGNLSTGAATVNGPYGLEIDGGRVYWTNTGAGSISWAKLDGSGGGDLEITGSATLQSPIGLAIAGDRIYWSNDIVSGKISYAKLETTADSARATGSADLNTKGATVSEPYGVAVDAERHRVYWANSNGGLAYADTEGSGGANLTIGGGFAGGAPNFPNLLEAPEGATEPQVHGTSRPGAGLNCSTGFWKPDRPAASLYRYPTSYAFQWTQNGQPVPGAASAAFAPTAAGLYRCTVTGSNLAGAASQTSRVAPVFRIGKLTRNLRKGTAKISVDVPGAGTLLVGCGGCRQTRKAVTGTGTAKAAIRLKRPARRRLKKAGKLKLGLTVDFVTTTPGSYGAAQTRAAVLRLKKK